jgi:hypothetical protein
MDKNNMPFQVPNQRLDNFIENKSPIAKMNGQIKY